MLSDNFNNSEMTCDHLSPSLRSVRRQIKREEVQGESEQMKMADAGECVAYLAPIDAATSRLQHPQTPADSMLISPSHSIKPAYIFSILPFCCTKHG